MAGSGLSVERKLFLGWFGPRGLASIVFMVMVVVGAQPVRTHLIKFEVKGDSAEIDCTMGSKLEDPWRMGGGFSVRVNGRSVEASPGDRLYGGLHTRNSEVGFMAVELRALVYRTICTNGLIMGGEGVAFRRRNLFVDSTIGDRV